MLLAAAVLAATAVANTGRPVWTVVPKTDCGGWDVKTHLACAAHPPHASPSVLTLKACCLSLPQGECGGFNTHGVMKKPGCRRPLPRLSARRCRPAACRPQTRCRCSTCWREPSREAKRCARATAATPWFCGRCAQQHEAAPRSRLALEVGNRSVHTQTISLPTPHPSLTQHQRFKLVQTPQRRPSPRGLSGIFCQVACD